MIVKGIVSSIDIESQTATVILPEYDNITTRPLKVYGNSVDSLNVNDFVLVIVFNGDFNDCIILKA